MKRLPFGSQQHYLQNDFIFFIKSVQSPNPLDTYFEISNAGFNPAFDISKYVSFSSSSTRSHNRKLSHKSLLFQQTPPGLWNKLDDVVDISDCSIFTQLVRDYMS